MKNRTFYFILLSAVLILLYGCTELQNKQIQRQDVQQQTFCSSNNDCQQNQYCSNGKCLNYECRIDSDCNSDEACINNKCNKISCLDGYIINHICKKYECTSDSQCRSDEICQNNKCAKLNCAVNLKAQDHQCTYQILTQKENYITPLNPLVLEKVQRLTGGDYSEENFAKNLKEIYYYATSIKYEYDEQKWRALDYWQTSDQTIEDGTGDCEDYAILLQSMIEALLFKTYGTIPKEVSYVVIGCVDMDRDGVEDGCHAWNILDASKLPKNAYTLSIVDPNRENVPEQLSVIVGDVTINESIKPEPKYLVYTPSEDFKKTKGLLAIYWQGRKWVELEPTWGMPMSYYESKGYPYVTVYRAFNSQEDYWYPDFANKDRKPTVFEDMIAYLFKFLRDVYNFVIDLFRN